MTPRNQIIRFAADGMAVTRDGLLLIATSMGIQICDQPRRVNLILTTPLGARYPSNVCFAGARMNDLIITCGAKIYRRRQTSPVLILAGTCQSSKAWIITFQ